MNRSSLLLLIVAFCSCGGGGDPPPPPRPNPPRATQPLPDLVPHDLAPLPKASPDTITIHVSSSSGSDTKSGLSPTLAVRTLAKGKSLVRDGKPDRLLLRRGDVWDTPLGRWKKRGRSAHEPLIVGAYGEGKRPLLRTGAKRGLYTNAGGGTPKFLDHVVVTGLHFFAHTRDPNAKDHSTDGAIGLQWLSGSHGVLIDDCVFQSYGTGMTFIDFDDVGLSNVVVQRCVIVDSYSVKGHSQGLFVKKVNGFTLRESVLDHNGWNEAVKGAQATIYNHNVYVQTDCTGVALIRNTILRGASHGVQLRPGGRVEENLFARNAISLLIGGGDKPVPGGVSAVASGNVIVEGRDITESLPRGWGIDLVNTKQVKLENTIVGNSLVRGRNAFAVREDENTTHTNTIVWNWPGSPSLESKGPRVDPGRSLATYKGAKSFEDFASRVRERSSGHETATLINWLRAGLRSR
jgi:hypothetical protein